MNTEELIQLLKQIPGVENVVKGETYPQCKEITGLYNGKPFFIYIFKGRYTNTPILRITPTPNACIEALTTPQGLYTIPHNQNQKTITKSLETKIKTITHENNQQK